jgi:hypothetical protein
MIIGAHAIVYSKGSEADRAFFKDVLGFPSVDVGGGWLIFGLPPAEVAVHPTDGDGSHELYLMTDDVAGFVADMKKRGIACDPTSDQRWGILTSVTLPSGGKLGVYEPRHASPKPAKAAANKPATKTAAAKTKAKASKPAAKPPKAARGKPKKPSRRR